MRWLKGLLILVAAAALLLVVAGRLGLLRGKAPGDLGVRDGRLKAPATTPNSVSSQADLWPGHPQQAYARIAPLAGFGEGPASLSRLAMLIKAMPDTEIVTQRDDYIYAQFTTPLMRYTDDVEFWWDRAAGVIQVRSASRLGKSDLGANRKRIEALRTALAAR